MVALTYSEAPAVTATKTAPAGEVQVARKGFFARLLDAMMEARMKQAQREIRLYARQTGETETFGG